MKFLISILTALMLVASGCVTTSKVDYPSYRLDEEIYQSLPEKKAVYIAPVELLSTRIANFRDVYGVMQSEIESYMAGNGYNVLSSGRIERNFSYNMAEIGGFYNQQTGKFDTKLLHKCIDNTIEDLKKYGEFSTIVIPLLVFSPLSLQRPYTRGTWNGVTRKVDVKTTSGMSFSPVRTMSIKLIVFSSESDFIFDSVGGIDFIQKVREVGSLGSRGVGLTTKESDEFSLEDIREGIEMAFHPFIFSEKIGDAKEKM